MIPTLTSITELETAGATREHSIGSWKWDPAVDGRMLTNIVEILGDYERSPC